MKRNYRQYLCLIFVPAIFIIVGPSASHAQDMTSMLSPVSEEIKTLQDEAQAHYSKAFSEADDREYNATAGILETLISQYGTDPATEEVYFYLADIYYARLQGSANCREAIRVLNKLLENIPGARKTLEAKLTIALIYYRYLNDLESATSTLDEYFDNLALYNYLESDKLQAQILLAKCYQKRGSYASEKKIWDALQITNPTADRTGRIRFLNEIKQWQRIPGESVDLFCKTDIPERTYRNTLQSAETELGKLVVKFGNKLPGKVEVYLYKNTDAMVLYTSLQEPLTLDGDREIHIAVDQVQQMPYLMAKIYSNALNYRSRNDRHPLMRSGFGMAYYKDPSGQSIDELAARQLFIFDKAPSGSVLLGESNFFGSNEYFQLAGSFCKFLIDNEPLDPFKHIYRSLYPHHTQEMVEDIFQRAYGKPFDKLVALWYASLNPIMAQVRSEAGALTFDLHSVDVDLSTSDSALASWYESLRMGDFDALMESSTPELRDLLKEAKKAYEDEGILQEIIIERFVYPYYPTTYRVIRSGELGADIVIYKISIIKDNKSIEEKDVTVKKISGKWYIDVNP